MEELFAVPGARAWATNEVLYNLSRERGIPRMAYSTIEQGRLRSAGALEEVAKKRGARPYPIALAWVMRRPDVIAIPKASGTEHVRETAEPSTSCSSRELALLEAAYPPAQAQEGAGDDLSPA